MASCEAVSDKADLAVVRFPCLRGRLGWPHWTRAGLATSREPALLTSVGRMPERSQHRVSGGRMPARTSGDGRWPASPGGLPEHRGERRLGAACAPSSPTLSPSRRASEACSGSPPADPRHATRSRIGSEGNPLGCSCIPGAGRGVSDSSPAGRVLGGPSSISLAVPRSPRSEPNVASTAAGS
jgi:hypothetical protein